MKLLCRAIFSLALLCAFSAHAEEESVSAQFALRYPKGSIASAAMAELALSEADKARASENAQFRLEEQACYPKFFTTSCLDAARERHHFNLAQIRRIELEANAFKRQARAAEREQAMKERQSNQAEQTSATDERVQRHEAKLKQLEEEDAAKAAQRNSNVAAYEKKQREAEERQQTLAKRKAEQESRLLQSGQ